MNASAAKRMIAMLVFGVSIVHSTSAQLLERRVTLTVTNATLEEALGQIGREANVKFFYSLDQLHIHESVSFHAENKTLRQILDALLSPYSVRYKVYDDESAIALKRVNGIADPPRSEDTEVSVTGVISDAQTHRPMPGVNILVSGTLRGTVTDADGHYTLLANAHDVLVFSFIGFNRAEVPVEGRNVIDVTMEAGTTDLKAVEVNAGYWLVSKQEQTGNIAQIAAADISRQPVSDPLATLEAMAPGLQVTQSTGMPGGNFTVRIRGHNSMTNGNDPLYLVDGVPFPSTPLPFGKGGNEPYPEGTSPLNNINPSDIERIEVLKDADATAIYGSRGANGVILITTKRSSPGNLKADVNFYSGFSQVAHRASMLTTSQYLQMRKEAIHNDGLTLSGAGAYDLLRWDTTRYTDWQKTLLGNIAGIADFQMSISGGSPVLHYSVGTGYHRETTVFPGYDFDQRRSVHVHIAHGGADRKFNTGLVVNYSNGSGNLPNADITQAALRLPPVAPRLYHDDGSLNWENSTWENPLAPLKRRYRAGRDALIANLNTSYLLTKGLEVKSSMGYTLVDLNSISRSPASAYDPTVASFVESTSIFSKNKLHTWIIEPQIQWKRKIGSGMLTVLAGVTFLDQTTNGIVQFAQGFANESEMGNIHAASFTDIENSVDARYRYNAIFGRINYTLKERYILNATGRRDGSSRFGPGKQFSDFGAVGVAWVFSAEPFVQNRLPWLTFGKLRGSFGVTGNDQIGDYQFMDQYVQGGIYQGTATLQPARLFNPDFGWETNRKTEAALELGFLHDRIHLLTSVYRNRSGNQLLGQSLPPTAGFPSVQENLPVTVQNTGVEFSLYAVTMQRQRFEWTSSLNLSLPKNKLVSFPGLEQSAYASQYQVGQPLDIRKLYRFIGVDRQSGIFQFEDVNHDGALTAADQVVIRMIGSEFYGGWQNSFRFRNIELSMIIQFTRQTGFNPASTSLAYAGSANNQLTVVMDRWTQPGDVAPYQRFASMGASPAVLAYRYYDQSDKAVFDTSFLRLRNISLSYSFPRALISRFQIRNFRMFLMGQNVLTITRFTGMDPETQGALLPPLRTITGGITIGI